MKCVIGSVNHYYLGFFDNYDSADTLSILLTSAETHQVQYSIEAPSVDYYYKGTIPAGDVVVLNISNKLSVVSISDQDKGIYLTTSSEKVTVIGQSLQSYSSDSYFALPITWLADTYIYYGISVPRSIWYYGYPYNSSILLVGTENNTVMKLTVTQSVTINVSNTIIHLIPGKQHSFVINRLQTVYVRSGYDLTGTKIVTDKPMSVFSGHECANVPWNISYCSYLIEQIPPVILWGKVYYTAPLASKPSYTIKIFAAYDSTNINIYCNNTKKFYTINEGGFVNTSLSMWEYCAVHSNKEILVVQLTHGGYLDSYGDPMMTLVPAVDQHLNKFNFPTLHDPFFNHMHHVNIIVMAQYYQPNMIHLITGGVNRSLVTQQWVPVQFNNITEAYTTEVKISEGRTELFHSNPAAQMMVIVYGFSRHDGYGHLGGVYLCTGC